MSEGLRDVKASAPLVNEPSMKTSLPLSAKEAPERVCKSFRRPGDEPYDLKR